MINLADIRRDYGNLALGEDSILPDPIAQFTLWLEEVLKQEKNDPTAMVLSTVDRLGHPDSRVVLLKGITEGNFIFYTNYQSTKAKQIDENPFAALNFFWPQMARQVRVRGRIKKTSEQESDAYFHTRPHQSQLSAIISQQSQEIANREILEKSLQDLIENQGQDPVFRPNHWGGYLLLPETIEFWQGRDNRLHDRIQFQKQEAQWLCRRLAP